MIKKISIILFFVGATLACLPAGRWLAHCLIGKAAFADVPPCPPECVTDTMEIVTWYPSPYNEYEELRLYPISVSNSECNDYNRGLMYYDRDDDKIRVCKGTLLDWQELGYWQLSGTDDIYNTNSGNVGIGTTDPLSKLDIRGAKAKATFTPIEFGFENILNLASTDSINPLTLRAGIKTAINPTNRYGAIEVDDAGTKRDLVLQPTAGNVGIGTTSPGAKLDVAGGVKIGDDSVCDSDKAGTMRYNSGKVQYCNGTSWVDVGGWKETAQGFRTSSSGRPIVTVSAPVGTTPFVALDNVCPASGSIKAGTCTYDGLKCNEAEGWKIAGAWGWVDGSDEDIFPYLNGAITNDFDQGATEKSILCVR